MFLLLILLLIALILGAIVVSAIAIGGAGFILVFGDVIICIAGIIWLIKKLFFK